MGNAFVVFMLKCKHYFQAAKALADDCASIPSFLCQDEYLATAFPSVRTRLLPFLQILDAAVWDLHCTAQVTAGSLSSTCVFMTTWKDLVTKDFMCCGSFLKSDVHFDGLVAVSWVNIFPAVD